MKDKTTAALFALFLGWFGIHRFYLRQPGLGILYIVLMTMGISFVLGIIDAIVLLAMDQSEFDRRYNDEKDGEEYDRYSRRRDSRDYRRSERSQERSRNTRATSRRSNRSSRETEQAQRKNPERYTRRQTSRSKAVRDNPDVRRKNPYKQSGIKKYKEFDLQEAIEDFVEGLKIDKRDVSLHFNIACAYSLTEQADKALYHLSEAVEYGFKDFKKIKTHDDLAFVRIQPEFEEFVANDFKIITRPQLDAPKENLLDDDLLLSQLNRLSELKTKGLITEEEFTAEKEKLVR